jgi:hypothetical protein
VKKVKKIIIIIAVIVLSMALFPTAVFAGSPSPPNYGTIDPTKIWPPYLPPLTDPSMAGVEKVIPAPKAPGGQIHIITDPLVPVGDDVDANGWVTFWCQSQIGFKYNIGATGLNRLSTYHVYSVGPDFLLAAEGDPGAIDVGEGMWGIPQPPIALDLGTLKTDAKGSGGVNGVAKLSSGHLYILWTIVNDGTSATILGSPQDDPNAFVVY